MRHVGPSAHRRRPSSILFLTLAFTVEAPGCSSDLTDPETLTLFVAPQLVECHTVGPQVCMQVRESPDEEWRLFYGSIEGFVFEAGFHYELRVQRYRVEAPPADGSSFRYVLLRLVSKVPDV